MSTRKDPSKKYLVVELDIETHRRMRVISAEHHSGMTHFIRELLTKTANELYVPQCTPNHVQSTTAS